MLPFFRHRPWVSFSSFRVARSYRTKSTQILPFEAARNYARTLGFTRSVEYSAWSKAGERPAFIPSNPWFVYREQGWSGFPDFLGYQRIASFHKSEAEICEAIAQQQSRIMSGRSPFAMTHRGQEAFDDFVHSQSAADEIEFRRLGYRSLSQYIFRPRSRECSVGNAGPWSPLMVRFRANVASSGSVIIGRIGESVPVTGWVYILGNLQTASERRLFFLPKPVVDDLISECSRRTSGCGGRGKLLRMRLADLLKYEVHSNVDFFSKLKEHYMSHEDILFSEDDLDHQYFLLRGGRSGARFSHLRQQFSDFFYAHLGVSVKSSMLASSLCDTSVGGKRVLHRAVTWETYRKIPYATIGLHKYKAGHIVPLHERDEFDFIIALDYDFADPTHTLVGVFIFPKHALSEGLTSEKQAGRLHLPLYSPRMPTRMKRSERRKEFCLRYYIDLSNPEILDEQIEKAKAIFDGRVDVADAAVSISGEGEGKSGVLLSDSGN